MGYALWIAQTGGKHHDAKARLWWSGGLEIIEDYRGDTFRAVYTLKYADVVFMLHAFQKKSKTGRATPRRDIELIKQRLRERNESQRRSWHEQQALRKKQRKCL
jgi:phage-related protein